MDKVSFPNSPIYRGVLPCTFDDTLSYYEQIAQLYTKMQELVTYVDSLEEFGHQYTDDKVQALRTEIQTQMAQIEGQANALQSQLDNLAAHVDTILPAAEKFATDADQGVLATCNSNIAQSEERLQQYINDNAQSIEVINFFTGDQMSIQQMFDYLCSLHAQADGITYATINNRAYTYNQITATGKTYSDLVKDGNTILPAK